MVRIGYPGIDLVELPGSPKISRKSSGPSVVEMFNVDFLNAEAGITTRGFDFGDPCPILAGIYSDATLDEILIDRVAPAGRLGMVTYLWKVPESGGGSSDDVPPVGTVTREGDSNVIERPIGQHPNANPGVNYNVDKQVGIGVWEGIESYIDPQPTYTRTETLDEFAFTEAAIIKNVAERFSAQQMIAKGLNGASSDAWLKMHQGVKVAGTDFEISETWQFNREGWRLDIYDLAVV